MPTRSIVEFADVGPIPVIAIAVKLFAPVSPPAEVRNSRKSFWFSHSPPGQSVLSSHAAPGLLEFDVHWSDSR